MLVKQDGSWWRERRQGDVLAAGDVSPFSAEVDFGKLMARVDDESLVPKTGHVAMEERPEEWLRVRETPSCVPSAINEILRMETPLQGYSRLVAQDYEMDEVTLVDVEAVRFLNQVESSGARLANCAPYIREWMTRERERTAGT